MYGRVLHDESEAGDACAEGQLLIHVSLSFFGDYAAFPKSNKDAFVFAFKMFFLYMLIHITD